MDQIERVQLHLCVLPGQGKEGGGWTYLQEGKECAPSLGASTKSQVKSAGKGMAIATPENTILGFRAGAFPGSGGLHASLVVPTKQVQRRSG